MMKKQRLGLSMLLAITLMATACGQEPSGTENVSQGGEIEKESRQGISDAEADEECVVTMAVTGGWESLNWLETNAMNSDYIIEQMFDRLYVVNTDGTFAPRLAESWELEGKTLTFHLNPDAKWQDGEPVIADDVVYTYRLWANPDCGWLRTNNCKFIEGTDDKGYELSEDSVAVEALDEHTVRITLKEESNLEKLFCSSFRPVEILPSHILAQYADTEVTNADYWDAPVGSGPFIYDSMIDGERIEMVANENYYLGAPDFDRFVIRVMNSSTIAAALLSGEIDVTNSVSITDLEMLKSDEKLVVEHKASSTFTSLDINLADETLNATFRQAVNAAIDKQGLVEQLLSGYGEAARSIYPSNHPYFLDVADNSYDPEHAVELLEEIEWDSSRVLELLTTENAERQRVAILVQQNLKDVGIETEIVTCDLTTQQQKMRENDFDMMIMGSGGMVEPSGVINSIEYFSNYIDAEGSIELAAKGASTIGYENRKPIYDEYQALYTEQHMIVMLYFSDIFCCYNNRLSDIPFMNENDFNINKLPWTWQVAK